MKNPDIVIRYDPSGGSREPWFAICVVPDEWYKMHCASGAHFAGMQGGENSSPFARERGSTPEAALDAVQRRIGQWYIVYRTWVDP